jgi:hypothetical protein
MGVFWGDIKAMKPGRREDSDVVDMGAKQMNVERNSKAGVLADDVHLSSFSEVN